MNQPPKMSHGPPPLAPRSNVIASPPPSSPITVKMNGAISPTPVISASRHMNGLPHNTPALPVLNKPGTHTPTKQPYEILNGLNDSKVALSHSVLHDTSQDIMSRSVMSAASGIVGGGPRLRTPNPIPTPTPTAPSNTTLTGTIPSPTLLLNPIGGGIGGAGSGSTTSASRMVMPEHVQDKSPRNNDVVKCCSFSVHELLFSLALLAVVSLLLASLAVLFLMKVMSFQPSDHFAKSAGASAHQCNSSNNNLALSRIVDANEYRLVYEIVVGLTTCTISLNFTCMLICCAQFIFASKLAKGLHGKHRALQYLKFSSCSRVIAIGGFFISIPVLLTGIILYAFINFEAKSAIITSLLIGVSIIFCGLAMIHNVYVWQKEKTKAAASKIQLERLQRPLSLKLRPTSSEQSSSQGLDVTQNASMELSTLV